MNDVEQMLLDEIRGLRGEACHTNNEIAKYGNRITVLETEAGYIRKAVIGLVALLAIPAGKAIAALCSFIKV